MNKNELIKAVAVKAQLTDEQSKKALNAFSEIVKVTLAKNEKIQFAGFGTFDTVLREGRSGRTRRKTCGAASGPQRAEN